MYVVLTTPGPPAGFRTGRDRQCQSRASYPPPLAGEVPSERFASEGEGARESSQAHNQYSCKSRRLECGAHAILSIADTHRGVGHGRSLLPSHAFRHPPRQSVCLLESQICNVGADRMLAAEVIADLAQLAQVQLQDHFRLRHLAAECFRFRARGFFAFPQRNSPTGSPLFLANTLRVLRCAAIHLPRKRGRISPQRLQQAFEHGAAVRLSSHERIEAEHSKPPTLL
jgi:hypothetical protein